MLKLGFLAVAIICLAHFSLATQRVIGDHLSDADLQRLQLVFKDAITSSDIQSVYFGAVNTNSIDATAKKATCEHITKLYKESKLNEFEKIFYLAATYKHLLCTQIVPESLHDTVSLKKEFATAQELYFILLTRKSIAATLKDDEKTALLQNIQTILKKDDSLSSLGYAFHAASHLGAKAAPIADWIEGAFAQADEIDGKMLQFEGGLSITGLLLNGAFKLTNALSKPAPITADQAVKFSTYLLSRRSVQITKGASVLLEALQTIATDKKIAPISVQVIGNGQLQPESPELNIQIVDLLGAAVSPAVSVVSAVVKKGTTVVVPKSNLTPRSSDKTVFSLNLSTAKLARGSYVVEVTVDSLVQSLSIRLLGKVKVDSLEIGVGEVDSTSNIKKSVVPFKQMLAEELNADAQQKLVLRAELVDEYSGKPIGVHQAFVRLEHKSSKEEIIFVAEQDLSKAYKFDLDIGSRSGDFGHKSGVYSLEFIVGDASLSNSFKWLVADINLKFSQHEKTIDQACKRTVRPEISHLFRVPEKRPSRIVSDVFTALCAAPLLVLFYLWSKLGVNVSNFRFSLSSIGFHIGFGAILALFGVFFWQLNMFETIRYLIPLALVTFFFGNRLLRTIANEKA